MGRKSLAERSRQEQAQPVVSVAELADIRSGFRAVLAAVRQEETICWHAFPLEDLYSALRGLGKGHLLHIAVFKTLNDAISLKACLEERSQPYHLLLHLGWNGGQVPLRQVTGAISCTRRLDKTETNVSKLLDLWAEAGCRNIGRLSVSAGKSTAMPWALLITNADITHRLLSQPSKDQAESYREHYRALHKYWTTPTPPWDVSAFDDVPASHGSVPINLSLRAPGYLYCLYLEAVDGLYWGFTTSPTRRFREHLEMECLSTEEGVSEGKVYLLRLIPFLSPEEAKNAESLAWQASDGGQFKMTHIRSDKYRGITETVTWRDEAEAGLANNKRGAYAHLLQLGWDGKMARLNRRLLQLEC